MSNAGGFREGFEGSVCCEACGSFGFSERLLFSGRLLFSDSVLSRSPKAETTGRCISHIAHIDYIGHLSYDGLLQHGQSFVRKLANSEKVDYICESKCRHYDTGNEKRNGDQAVRQRKA